MSTKWRNISLVSQGRNRRTTGDNIARTARRQLNGLENICRLNNPLSPTLADKHAPLKTNLQFCNIDGGKRALPCLQTRNHFWKKNKTIIEFDFRIMWRIVEIWGGVLSTSAHDTLFDLHNASYDTQPRPIIVNYHSMHFFSPLLTAKIPPFDFQLTAYK